jgi:hypothetical protein
MLSMFLPCYNEEDRLVPNVERVYAALRERQSPFELIIVDDGSVDDTPVLGRRIAELHDEVSFVHYDNGPSRRENLGAALRSAKGAIVAFMDLDLAVDLSCLPRLIDGVHKCDISTGSRYVGERPKRSIKRRLISSTYNGFMRWYFASQILDHQCGFKAFRREVLFSVLDKMGYDATHARSWFWDAELLIRSQHMGFSIDEFSVPWHEGGPSSFSMRRELRMVPQVLRLRSKL